MVLNYSFLKIVLDDGKGTLNVKIEESSMYKDMQYWPIYLKYGPIQINEQTSNIANTENTVSSQHFSFRYLHILK